MLVIVCFLWLATCLLGLAGCVADYLCCVILFVLDCIAVVVDCLRLTYLGCFMCFFDHVGLVWICWWKLGCCYLVLFWCFDFGQLFIADLICWILVMWFGFDFCFVLGCYVDCLLRMLVCLYWICWCFLVWFVCCIVCCWLLVSCLVVIYLICFCLDCLDVGCLLCLICLGSFVLLFGCWWVLFGVFVIDLLFGVLV